MRSATRFLTSLLLALAWARETPAQDELAPIRELRLRGLLSEARASAEKRLAVGGLDHRLEIEIRLELARIHDRIGLHQNTRPVSAALEQIEAAARVMAEPPPEVRAVMELARAEFHYRAETPEREFRRATLHAARASELFHRVGDERGEADALHLRGLIHLQRGEYEGARELFDRSLALDRTLGERPLFRADYERHVGFLFLLEDDVASSIPHFERSLSFRRRAGAVDASLFAARILASALVELDRLEEAEQHLLYALMVAERLNSPTGKARTGLVLGRMYERAGDDEAARTAYEMTLGVAESVGYRSIAEQSRDALERLEAIGAP